MPMTMIDPAWLMRFIRGTAVATWLVEGDGYVMDVPEWIELTGQTAAEAEGDGWMNAIHPEDVPRVRAAWQTAVVHHQHYNTDYRVRCADEQFLSPHPHESRAAWCRARCEATEARLTALGEEDVPRILVNHWPLREELAKPPRIPRFSLWCGTKTSEDWHLRFGAAAVISGHLHMPRTRVIDGVAFEEVSFGYPKQWQGRRAPDDALRRIVV